jgi:Ca-activated chloride channel family protein
MIRFAQPMALLLLIVAPALAALFRYGDTRRRAALAHFGTLDQSGPAPNRKRTAKRSLIIAAAVLTAVAIARPVKRNAASPSGSGDVVFLLDVSRSMLSRDAMPNRLRRAKQIAADIAARVAGHIGLQPGGQRLGLIAFAGNAAVLCPLTIDQDYFREMLDGASSESVTRGGSRIGDALRFALSNGFDDVRRGSKDLILLTDGGDQDSQAPQAAQALVRAGIRLTVIGVGDPEQATEVPVSETDPLPFFYNGSPVMTRLESAELRAVGGAYWEGGGAFDAVAVVRRIAARPDSRDEAAQEYYPLLLALAAVLLALECMLSERAPLRTVAAVLALAAYTTAIRAQSAAEWIRQGNDAFAGQQYEAAATCYRNAAGILPASPQVQFDLGVAMYKAGLYAPAADAFAVAADRARDPKLQAKSLLGEGNAYFRSSAASASSNSQESVRALERSIELYSSALAADAKSQDAAFNLAIAKKKLEDMKRRKRAQAAQDYATSSMRHEQAATSDPNEILKDAKQKSPKQQNPRRSVPTDW